MAGDSGSPEGPRFGLTLRVLAPVPFVEIEREEFEALRRARAWVVDGLGLEESFHRVLGNFFEYEATLLERALHSLVFTEGDWSEFVGLVHEVNRRVQNVLSGGRAYLDQAEHMISARFDSSSDELTGFKEARSEQYDTKFGYRVMCRLRNYALHRGVVVHALRHANWRDKARAGVRRNCLVPILNPPRLREDGGFHAETLELLEEMGDQVDLRPLVREYVVGLSSIHDGVRQTWRAKLEAAEQAILDANARYDEEGQGVVGLAAVERASNGTESDHVPLLTEVIDRRRDLVRRSRRVPHLVRAYTTNEEKV